MPRRWPGRTMAGAARRIYERAAGRVGGVAYLQPVLVLASVVSLDGADKGTLSVNAQSLEDAFGIGHAALGLIASITSLTGAAFTFPVGVLTDRVVRVRLLGGSVMLWAVATVMSAVAPSFTWFLVARAALGAVTATAGPTVASLVGDYFPAGRRAQLYAYVLMGEFLGTGIGLVVTTAVTSFASWRFAVAWPALPAILLSWYVWRTREPTRGGQSGTSRPPRGEVAAASSASGEETVSARTHRAHDAVRRVVVQHRVSPRREAVLRDDPRHLPVRKALWYVLRVRTIVIMIVASSLGYFFFAGVRTFAVLFAGEQYGVSRVQASALIIGSGAGGLVGLYIGGRVADRLLRGGNPNGRIIVPVVSLLVSPLALVPAILTSSPLVALPLLVVGVAAVAATNPPMDAARLDVVPSGLWGTSEAARTVLRTCGELAAPLVFGYLSADVFDADGLKWTFLVCLAPVVAAGLLGLLALRTYPRDVATATASDTAVAARGT
ncbi:MFS transporter [Streptomyces sp. OR43]|uniref:MFS transporter n=1 Tax=Streptomyces sp. or43 TaxID=2478957 RepID=UPI0011CD4C5B|nr:MFS transporter [Streptomyces sp. or43]TXS38451.1 MFS transporter [Streptomyces sp. or43]